MDEAFADINSINSYEVYPFILPDTKEECKVIIIKKENGTVITGMESKDTEKYITLFGCVIDLEPGKYYLKMGKLHRESDNEHYQMDKPAVIRNNQKKWYKEGLLHRENDLPAIECYDDDGKPTDMLWYRKGVPWRGNGLPTAVMGDGTRCWDNEEGQYHRDGDLPAIEYMNGDKKWYINGELHREDDKPAIVYFMSGEQRWCKRHLLHRDNGLPAVIHADGTKEWYINGKLHREGGLPAIEYANGDKEWYEHGELIKDSIGRYEYLKMFDDIMFVPDDCFIVGVVFRRRKVIKVILESGDIIKLKSFNSDAQNIIINFAFGK